MTMIDNNSSLVYNGLMMNEQGTKMRIRVDIIESERGWGQKIEEVKYFDSITEAAKFVESFNAENDSDEVPDWYMYAKDPIIVG